MMLFALEGLVCLLMAFPIAGAIAVLGALVGRAIATHTQVHAGPGGRDDARAARLRGRRGEARAAAAAPGDVGRRDRRAASKVWTNVIGFSELPPPAEWLFQTGIACPMRARIEGSGVGAVRHCEFSTGAFVEPVTVWEPGKRLAFDVAAQPPAMKEWSPYRAVHPPHLDGASARSTASSASSRSRAAGRASRAHLVRALDDAGGVLGRVVRRD